MPHNGFPAPDRAPATAFASGGVAGVRVGGMPVADLEALRCERTWAAVREAVALDGWLRTEGAALSDLLHPVIGHCADDTRPLLVALRRAVFRGRRPTARTWSAAVREALPDDLVARVDHWVLEWARHADVVRRVPDLLITEQATAREALRVAAGRDAFRFALALGSPELTLAVDGWLDDPTAPPPRPRAVLSLARYLARAATKPSPYASFTLSGLGTWTDGPPTSGDLDWIGVPELDRSAVLALWDGLAARPELRDHTGLRVNPSAEEDGGRLWFLGAATGEPIVSVAVTDALREILRFVRDDPDPRVGPLIAHLADARARAYVDELITAGLLERCRPFRDQSTDPLAELVRWVTAHAAGSPWPARLHELRAAVCGYPGLTTAVGRVDRLRSVRRLVDELLADLGRSPRRSSRPVLVENAVLPHPVMACSRGRWAPVLEDLEALRGFLGVLDRSLPVKLRVAAFFRDRYGSRARVGFLRLYRDYHATRGPSDNAGPLLELRRDALAELYRGDDGTRATVSVDPQALAKLAASWPAYVRAPHSVCCYGQELPGEDGPRFALNTVRTGYGWGITRVEHLLAAAGRTPPPRAPRSAPGVVLAECRAAFGSQLNQRTAAVPCHLDHPGGERTAGAVAPTDLRVRYDPADGRLGLCDRRGRQVRPLALGMLVEHLLPPALRFLVGVFGEPQTAFAPAPQLDDAGWRPPVDGVAHRPRLEVGLVVVARAGWRVAASDVPTRAKGRTDADFLLELAGWFARHGIPHRCFARTTGRRDGLRKPVFLDLADWFLVAAFRRSLDAVAPDTSVVFEEALPDPADAPRHGDRGRRATEYVFELSAVEPRG